MAWDYWCMSCGEHRVEVEGSECAACGHDDLVIERDVLAARVAELERRLRDAHGDECHCPDCKLFIDARAALTTPKPEEHE